MHRAFRNLRINRKLTVVIVAASMVTLVLASVSLLGFHWWNTRRVITRDLLAQGQILAANAAGTLKFQDESAATEILSALRAKPYILAASLHLVDGEPLARYGVATDAPARLPPGRRDGLSFDGPLAELVQPVVFKDRRVGSLLLRFDVRAMEREILGPFLLITAGILAAAFLTALGLTAALHPLISRPLVRLAETARAVAENQDYSVRARKDADDEIGLLTDAFNQMLGRIGTQDAALRRSRLQLEALVHSIDGIVWECAPDTLRFSFVSRQSERLLGYPAEAWLADPGFWNRHIHPDDSEEAQATTRKKIAERQPYQHEYRMMAADDRVVWIRESGVVLVEDDRVIAVRGLFLDVTAQKSAADELDALHRRLLEISRQAGMAEVATGVLHNVGNVLNSVNVSANLVIDRLGESKVSSLPKLAALLEEHAGNLPHFLTTDPRGRRVPSYIATLARNLSEERLFVFRELTGLRKHIDHIKDIVAMQQNYARVSGVTETLPPSALIDDALQINTVALARHGIRVVREFDEVPMIAVEKHKVLQILVNLVRNAKFAINQARATDKRLRVRLHSPVPDRIRIEVIDNGVGIAGENLTRIFQHGFTTRDDGHGFGLHSGALTARELGGSLTVRSDGPGTGATFILELPLARPASATCPVGTQPGSVGGPAPGPGTRSEPEPVVLSGPGMPAELAVTTLSPP